MGTTSPQGSLHIHDTRYHEPELPPTPDVLRDNPYGDYITDLHLTNTWTGSTANDGFSVFQYNNSVTLQQREGDDLNIFAHNGNGITINANGLIGMGTSPTNAYRLNINSHHHLPDIPSAEEATQDGIDIATLNALLLQKIEELTL